MPDPAKIGAQCQTPSESLHIEPPDAERLKQLTPRVALLRTEARGVALPAGTLLLRWATNQIAACLAVKEACITWFFTGTIDSLIRG
jgi:hypothetical protein